MRRLGGPGPALLKRRENTREQRAAAIAMEEQQTEGNDVDSVPWLPKNRQGGRGCPPPPPRFTGSRAKV